MAARPPSPPSRLPGLPPDLVRLPHEGLVAGVCAGVARWLGVDPVVIRLATVVLALANGVGALAYLVAWAVLPTGGPAGEPAVGGRAAAPVEDARRSGELALAVGAITIGLVMLVSWSVPFFPDRLVWPAVVVATGAGLVLTRAGDSERARWLELAGRLPGNPVEALRGGGWLWVRVIAGGALLVTGLGLFLAANQAVAGVVGQVGVAVLATALGAGLLFGPWIVRLAAELRAERRERIRTEERAEMAAHLHDSVLQTLALIQREPGVPAPARSLARRQERELRAWLYRDARPGGDDEPATLSAALDRLVDEVEVDHRGVEVDVVRVGDCPLDDGVAALVRAVREAVVNAAKHSGAPEVSVYVEVGEDAVEAFVRDRGRGFDPATVDGDRRGIAESIVNRMARHGGAAEVQSAPGEGTEVSLRVARGRAEAS
ncbi:MAG: PspC domain-containing protein [Thermoanaerobacterales bacterium]|jgi:signal transduction histidine kinase